MMDYFPQVVQVHPIVALLAISLLAGLGLGLHALATAVPDPNEEHLVVEAHPAVRPMGVLQRLELRQQIAHEQEEAEAHDGI